MTTNEATSTEDIEKKAVAPTEGQKLAGCYLLKARVGPPGPAELWLANDDVLGRDISLQFIPDKIREDSKAVTDLRQEIKKDRQLIHPNILRVFDFVEEPDWAAVSMDAFEGESLASVIEKRGSRVFSVSEIESWAVQLCQTLEDAHKIGVFHRDISPANIYFRPDGKILLAGFGFSRCVGDALRRLDGHQDAATVNMSPQLLDGQPAARTDDIYACGVLFYELLTGQAPFSGADIANQIRNSPPKPVSEARPKDLPPVPENWEKAIAACLSKNPAERPPSAAKLAERLTAAPEASVLEMLTPAPVFAEAAVAPEPVAPAAPAVNQIAAEPAEAKESIESAPAPAAPAEPPAPAPAAPTPSSFPLGRRNISSTADLSASSAAPAPKTSPEKAPLVESAVPARTPRSTAPKTVKQDSYSSVYGDRSRSPLGMIVAAAAVLLLGLIGYHFLGSHNGTTAGNASNATPAVKSRKEEAPPPAPNEAPAAETPAPEATPQTGNISAGQTPALPASASPAEKALAQKQAEVEKAAKALADADKTLADLAGQQERAEKEAGEAKEALNQKTLSVARDKKSVDELLAKKKKLEDDQKSADAAAQQAKQAAEEKQRIADAAKQAVEDLLAKNQDKFAVADKMDAQLADEKKALEEKQTAVAAAAKAVADAEAAHARQTDDLKARQQAVADAKAAIEHEQQVQTAKQQQLKQLDDDLQKLKQRMNEQLNEMEKKRKQLESDAALPDSAPASLATPAPLATPVPAKKTPASTPPRSASNASTPSARAPGLPPLPEAMPNPMPTATPTQVAKLDQGPKVTVGGAENGANSLGQKFVPVGDVEFCIWQTRVKDFEVFAHSVGLKSVGWRSPGFKQGPDHPVVNVTWIEAIAFCKWLTDKEHKEGLLPANQFYRLPTDLEWSKAVGLPEEPEKTPADRDMVITDVYPWGKDWPPPPGAGNYTGEETGSDVAIKGYNDGFAWTSPVGSFKPNKYGLYDMGGNVWQWCMDSWNEKSNGKVLRGASWYNGALKLSLLSSCRVHAAPDSSTDNYGFRIVKATEGSRAAKK